MSCLKDVVEMALWPKHSSGKSCLQAHLGVDLKAVEKPPGAFGKGRRAAFDAGCRRIPRAVLLLLVLGSTWCCTTAPERLDRFARNVGCLRRVVTGAGFDHVVYYRRGAGWGRVLHVYFDGDGSPWIAGRFPAADPTPRNPLVLRLLARDSGSVLYLGRPCYNGLAESPGCRPDHWTYGRYSEAVVASMEAALRRFLERHPFSQLVFVGYSGGGTIAMLLAPRFASCRLVVTLAGNLDPDRWCARHGYEPLRNSLNPSHRPPLPDSIAQLHYIGSRDGNVPVELVEEALSRQVRARLRVLAGCGHADCWEAAWPSILREIDRRVR